MSKLKDKMYQFEAMPPAGTWDRIASALDEAHLDAEFPDRLHEMELTPPANAWATISAALNEEEVPATPVIQMRRRISPILKYAAAAAIVAILTFLAIRLNNGNDTTDATASIPPTTTDTQNTAVSKVPETAIIPEVNNNDNNNTLAVLPKTVGPEKTVRIRTSTASAISRSSAQVDVNDADFSTTLYTYDDYIPDIANRYITLLTPEGGVIRMSKKWSTLLCCVSGEEQDAGCKNQLQQWQKKIACSPVASTGGGFLDILSLVNTLSDDVQL